MRQRVSTVDLGRWVDPVDAWLRLCADEPAAFWLDSGPSASTGVSYLGVPSEVATEFDRPVLEWLADQLPPSPDTAGTPEGFRLGWVGWLGYEVRSQTMGTPQTRQSRHPDAMWMRVERCLAFDHAAQTVRVLSLGDATVDAEHLVSVLEGDRCRPVATGPSSSEPDPEVRWAYDDERYLAMVRACQEAIRQGDAYQLCLTTEATVELAPDPFATYLAVREASPTHHGALLVTPEVAVLCASPEQFLSVDPQGTVTTSPIKGTRARGVDAHTDADLANELESSDKERAENLMIVDLMRNDLSRICEIGSVAVTSLLAVETYAQVHQLVSTVRGVLRRGLTGIDAITACFPAGSMTGAPKHAATLILDRLEQRPRGIYSGALGYVGLDGSVDLAMVIRSIVIADGVSTVGTGGGITALSIPEEELAETRLKARPLLRALGARI